MVKNFVFVILIKKFKSAQIRQIKNMRHGIQATKDAPLIPMFVKSARSNPNKTLLEQFNTGY